MTLWRATPTLQPLDGAKQFVMILVHRPQGHHQRRPALAPGRNRRPRDLQAASQCAPPWLGYALTEPVVVRAALSLEGWHQLMVGIGIGRSQDVC